jgi:AraC-like DNA-binding protein
MLRHPLARAEGVAERLDVSERQLRRRCQAAVGYGPATLRRVLRFRRFVAWADAGAADGDLATVAADLGYADQAHLTRECARLAGLTPTALLAARRPAAAMIPEEPARLNWQSAAAEAAPADADRR